MLKAIKNSILLFFSQTGAYIIPLVELPILTRSLSPEVLGSIFFLQGVILTTSIVVEYGFNYNATRKVAMSAKSNRAINLVFTSVYSAKIVLFSISIFFLGLYFIIFDDKIPSIWLVFATLQFVGFAFSPYWYFQGMQELKTAVSCDLVIRFLYLILIIYLVENDEDALLVVMLQGISSFLITLITSVIAMRKVSFFKLSLSRGIIEIRSGFEYFLFKGGATLLLSLNTIIVGHFMSFSSLAIFVSAEKIVKAGAGIFNPIMNAFYPYFCERNETPSYKISFIFSVSGLAILATVILYFLSPILVFDVLKLNEQDVLTLLSLFIFLIPIKVACQSIVVSLLLPSGEIKVVSKITMFSSVILLLFSLINSIYFNLESLVKAILFVEVFILIYYIVFIKRKYLC